MYHRGVQSVSDSITSILTRFKKGEIDLEQTQYAFKEAICVYTVVTADALHCPELNVNLNQQLCLEKDIPDMRRASALEEIRRRGKLDAQLTVHEAFSNDSVSPEGNDLFSLPATMETYSMMPTETILELLALTDLDAHVFIINAAPFGEKSSIDDSSIGCD